MTSGLKKFWAALFSLAAVPAAAQEFVPFQQVLSENAGAGYECVAPLRDGSACGAWARYSGAASNMHMTGVIAFVREPRLVVKFSARGRIVDGYLCVSSDSLDMELVGRTDPLLRQAFELAKSEEFMPMMSDSCTAYFRDPRGGYRLRYYEDGAWQDDVPGFDRSLFMEAAPPLVPLFEITGTGNPFQ